MVSRISHGRVSMRKRIAEENREYKELSTERREYFVPKIRNIQRTEWTTFESRKGEGKSAAWILFERPNLFVSYFLTDKPLQNLPENRPVKIRRYKQFDDLRKVGYRAAHILLPPKDRGHSEFVWICDEIGAFEKIVIVRKGEEIKLREGLRELMRSEEIAIGRILKLPNRNLGLRRFANCLKKIFGLCHLNYELFFDDDRNFNMSSVWRDIMRFGKVPTA